MTLWSGELNTQGDDLPIDIAFQRIALSIRGQRAVGTEVKLEIFEEMIVPVKNIAYTQRWCSNYFRGGPYAGEQLQVVIDYLISGAIDPLNDSWLTLDIVKRNGKLQSVDNRRLYCLKAWQAQDASKDIQARIRLRVWDPLFDRYLQHNETDSTSIRHLLQLGGTAAWMAFSRRFATGSGARRLPLGLSLTLEIISSAYLCIL